MRAGKWGVLLFERPAKALAVAREVAEEVGLVQYDVMQGLRDERNYILDFLDRQRAERVAEALVGRGVAAVAQPASALDFAVGAGVMREAVLGEKGMVVRNPLDGSESSVSWSLVWAVLLFHREAAPRPALPERPRRWRRGYGPGMVYEEEAAPPLPSDGVGTLLYMAGEEGGVPAVFRDNPLRDLIGGVLGDFIFSDGAGGGAGRRAEAVERAIEAMGRHSILTGDADEVLLFVMGDEPVVVSVVERSGFNYGYLGERRSFSSVANFQRVVEDAARYGRPFYCNRDFLRVVRGGGLKGLERVRGRFVDRWLRERVLMVRLLWGGEVPEAALSVMDAEESILFLLE